jgi:hypothetical protein
MKKVKWMDKPEDHDYDAAFSYLSLLYPVPEAEVWRDHLRDAGNSDGELPTWAAKDILRATGEDLLPADNKHVAKDLAKIEADTILSPILLIRGHHNAFPVIADGYHRVCASYWIDENEPIPVVIV